MKMDAKDLPKSKEEYEAMLAALPEDQREGLMRLIGMMKPWETLDPELEACLVDYGPGGMAIKHPMVNSIMYAPMMAGQMNEQLRKKKAAAEEMRANGEWWNLLFLIYEGPFRLDAFLDLANDLSDEDYWKLAGQIWTHTENAFEQYDEWREVFEADRACRTSIMDDDCRKVYRKLPEQVLVFRGGRTDTTGEYDAANGFSWTLSRTKAEWFARRFSKLNDTDYPEVVTGFVQKRNVIAYFDGRGEQEILALPEHVKITKRTEIR